MKIALAHDSFTQLGGAERVMEAFHELFPTAPIFSLVLDKKLKKKYQAWDIRTSWLQVFYNFIPKLQYFLPLVPLAVSSLDFSGYDVIISSSSSFIKNIRVPKNCIHICYCHTPTRFLWDDGGYLEQEVPGLLKPLAKLVLKQMKNWDYKGAQRVSYFLANSKEVQSRIQSSYQRISTLIHAFVDIKFWHSTATKGNYFLLAGRLQHHKNNEMIIQIFNEIDLPLHVVGTGRQENYLKLIAKQNIDFLGRLNDERLRDEYSGAMAYIYPQLEDFGLMPLEAAACGTATLAYGKGGALETVMPGLTGEFFYEYNKDYIKQLILNWAPDKYRAGQLRVQAEKFSKERFKEKLSAFVNSKIV